VTNTGPTLITGDLGVWPGTSITGGGSITLIGAIHQGDTVAQGAQAALTTAYINAMGRTPSTTLASAQLSGQALSPGVYNSPTLDLSVGGTLTLNGGANSVVIFQVGSTLVTGSGSTIALTGGAQACNVFWQVGSSATLGTNSNFVGAIMALASITAQTGARI
jgi:hypothetical protein